jgi:prepilin peptidase CpaA
MLPIEVWNEGIAVGAGLIACGIDLKYRKIPNWLTLTTLGFGLTGHALSGLWSGLDALGGCLTGLALLVIPFATGGIGGGDVKLLMALGALLGVHRVFWVFIYAGIAGGIFSLLALVYRLGLSGAFWRLQLMPAMLWRGEKTELLAGPKTVKILKIPYGVALFCGLTWEIVSKLDKLHTLWG